MLNQIKTLFRKIKVSFKRKSLKYKIVLAVAAVFIVFSFFLMIYVLIYSPGKKDFKNQESAMAHLDSNLVLYFSFNNQGPTGANRSLIYDFSGNKNNGIVYNSFGDSTGGIFNDGVFESNSSTIIEVKNSKTLSPSTYENHFTVSFFVKFYSTNFTGQGSNSDYVNYIIKGSPKNYEWEFREYNSSNIDGRNDRLSFYVFSPEGGLGVGAYFQDTIIPGEWIFVTGVIDGNEIKIYKNGVLRNTQFLSQENIRTAHTNSDLYIGSPYFEGSIDEFMIYNKSLNHTEVRDLYSYYLQNANVTVNGI